MLARFMAAFQVSEGKVYNVGSHVGIFTEQEADDPAKHFSSLVVSNKLKGPRSKDQVYMFLSVGGELKTYTFTQTAGTYIAKVAKLKEEAFMAGTPKEDLVMAALQNLHDQVLLSIAQAGLMAELLAGTAGSLMIKETKK